MEEVRAPRPTVGQLMKVFLAITVWTSAHAQRALGHAWRMGDGSLGLEG